MKNSPHFVFINAGMLRRAGHDYSWNLLLHYECNRRGIEHSFLFRKGLSTSLLKEFPNSYPILTNTIYTEPFFKVTGDPYNLFIKQSKQIYNDFKNLKISITNESLLFCHSADPATILGMLWWCATLPPKRQPSLLFFFHFSFSPLGEWATKIFIDIRRALTSVSRAFFCACVDSIASFLANHLQKEIPLFPMPFSHELSRYPSHDIIYGFVGGGRLEQGPAYLAPLATEYIKRGGKNRFIFQIGYTQQHHDIVPIKLSLENAANIYPKQIKLIPHVINNKEYYDILANLTLLILPYDPDKYHLARPSQILQESIAIGIPSLVCKGSSLAYEVTKYSNGSIIIDNLNIYNLCESLFKFESNIEKHLQQAKFSGEQYRYYNNINNFMKLLLKTSDVSYKNNIFSSFKTVTATEATTMKNISIFSSKYAIGQHEQKKLYTFVSKKLCKKYYKMLSHSILFNAHYYLTTNPDVAKAGMDPLLHFVRHGWQEGRKPNPIFDPEYYLAVYPDVAEAGMNPLCHYIEYGWKEERNPSAQFNTLEYLENNEDVRRANMNPLEHFLKYGLLEGRNIN